MKIIYSFCFSFFFCSFCQAQGFWTQRANFNGTARGDAFSFSMGTKGYIGGGEDVSGNYVNDFWEYDAVNNSWNQKGNFVGIARWQAVSFTIGNKGYVGLGGSNSGGCNDFWEYDFSNDTWTQKASLPADKRTAAVGFSIGMKGYVGSGWGCNPPCSSVNHNDFWEWDQGTNIWTRKTDIPGYKRSYAVGLSIANKGYIGTGNDTTGNQRDDWWEYDPINDSWTQKTNFPGGMMGDIDGGHFIIGNYGYVGTGRYSSVSTATNHFWRYYPLNDSWVQIPDLPSTVRLGAINFSINGSGYIGLGFDNNLNKLNDLWKYTDTTLHEGILENILENYFSLYPNPTNGKITVRSEKYIEVIRVYNKLGEKIFETKSTSFDISSQPSGIYFLQLKTTEGVAVKKIILQR